MKMKHVLVAFMVLGLAFTHAGPAFSQASLTRSRSERSCR